MSIQPISSSQVRNGERAPDAAPIPPQRTAAAPVESRAAVEKSAPVPSQDELKQAIDNINKSLQAQRQDLVFSVDTDSKRTIVKVVDQKTNEVIRQIPTPEALEISKALDSVQGLLIKQTA